MTAAVLIAAFLLVGSGVAGAKPKPPKPKPTTTTTPPPPDVTVADATVPQVAVYSTPGAATPTRTLANPNRYRGKLVLLVNTIRPDGWIQVLLPVRPNGTTGWIRGSDVLLARNPFRIVVQLTAHRISVYRRGVLNLRAPVGVGKTNTPTPGGGYYLTQLFRPPNPNGAYGPFAYSLSGYSDVLTSFQGGDAIIGLHGTNHPELVGKNVSSGCIRMRNGDITKLAHVLPLGTPVNIVA